MLHRVAIAHPRMTLLLGIAVVVVAALGVSRLQIRTDGRSLIPNGHPQVLYDREVRETFGIRDQFIVIVNTDHPQGVFNPATLALISDLSTTIAHLERVRPDAVMSLATEPSDRVYPGTLEFRPFLNPIPQTGPDIQRLRDDLRDIALYTGTLVSRDDRSAAIFVGCEPEQDRTRLYAQLRELADARRDARHDIHVVGAPVAEALLGTHLLDDLGMPPALIGRHAPLRGDRPNHLFPANLYELRGLIGSTVGLIPIAIAILALVFLIAFRSFIAMLLPLGEVAACQLFVFGLMGWLGVPLYLTTTVMPLILTAIGLADEIHIFMRYREHLSRRSEETSHLALLHQTMDEMWRPVTKTSLTTAIGFLSFALSPIGALQAFGVFTAVGIIFCFLWSLTVIPACLVLVSPEAFVPASGQQPPSSQPAESPFARVARFTIRHRISVLATAAIVAAFAAIGVGRLQVQDSWIKGFAADSEFRRATESFNRNFLGAHVLLVTVDTGGQVLRGAVAADAVKRFEISLPAHFVEQPQELVGQWLEITTPVASHEAARAGLKLPKRHPALITTAGVIGDYLMVTTDRRHGSLWHAARFRHHETLDFEIRPRRLLLPPTLDLLCELGEFIRTQTSHEVGGVLGPCEYLATTNYLIHARREETRRLPDSPLQIRSVWADYERAVGTRRLRQVVDQYSAEAVLTVFMKDANFASTEQLLEDIQAYEREHLAPHGISLNFAGDVTVSQTLIGAVVSTQLRSLGLSLVGILLLTSLLGRSIRWGLFCVLPCAMAVLIVMAAMGALGVPLGVATSMFAGMTLGIGVDYAIHFMERYRLAAERDGSGAGAIIDAVAHTGPAVFIDALAVTAGFGVLMLSQVPANARLGGLVLLTVMACFAATLLLLPALLALSPQWREHRGRQGRWHRRNSPK